MRPRRTDLTSICLELPGGNEDNYLWMHPTEDQEGKNVMATFWEPTKEELDAIQRGGKIVLFVWGSRHPPVEINVLAPD